MPEYTYLLETRLSPAQKSALHAVRDVAREAGMTVFLAGGAIRDLTTGSSVRDLDFSVQGNALQLEDALRARGAELWGRHEASRTLFLFFPGSVRVEVAATRTETFPKPGQPVYEWSGMVDDLHRRDFTANAMALSLNEGSYGLLLDPLNGVADIEARQLRLVSNYGFLEDPARLVRLTRLRQRLGWTVEGRTQTRYENAKEAENFSAISAFQRGYEIEEIAAEEDGPAVLRALAAEGWMGELFPDWTPDCMDTPGLEALHRERIQLLIQGISPDLAAAHLQLMTAKMKPPARDTLKAAMVRTGLRAQWEGLDAAAKEFAQLLTGKDAAVPSAAWKLFHTHSAEPILWLAHAKRTPAVDAKFKNLFTTWPEIAKKVPVALMLELRITPELPNYDALLHELFLAQIDGKLETDEAMRAFLEPYSPPAPPPPVSLKRSRGKKAGKRKDIEDEDEEDLDERKPSDDDEDEEEDEDEASDGPPELDLNRSLASVDLGAVLGRIATDPDEDDAPEPDIEPELDSEPDGKAEVEAESAEEAPEAEPEPPAAPAKKKPAKTAVSDKEARTAAATGEPAKKAAPLKKAAASPEEAPKPAKKAPALKKEADAAAPAKKAPAKKAAPPAKKQ